MQQLTLDESDMHVSVCHCHFVMCMSACNRKWAEGTSVLLAIWVFLAICAYSK